MPLFILVDSRHIHVYFINTIYTATASSLTKSTAYLTVASPAPTVALRVYEPF